MVNTWGSYGSGKRPGIRGGGRDSSLFSCFRAWTCIFRGNSRTFRVAASGVDGFCMVIFMVSFFVVILVLFGVLRCF